MTAVLLKREHGFYLAILVFVCGWILMMLEMLGARILAPTFGTGIYVWGSVIGIFLLALSVGYYVGGRLSTRFPLASGVAGMIALCAVWIGLLPYMHRPVNDWIFEWWVVGCDGGEQWGSLQAAIILFLVPSVLLGCVSPYAIRLAATDVGSVGEKAGLLYAVSTFGSFLGCLITSFYLIVWMGVNRILQVHALVLLLTAGVFWAVWSLRAQPTPSAPGRGEPPLAPDTNDR